MSDHPLKSTEKNIVVMQMIEEITSFSTIRMFGHLFDLPDPLRAVITPLECQCSQLLNCQLYEDLLPEDDKHDDSMAIVALSTLESSLSKIFNSHSEFWEQYYRRVTRRMHRLDSIATPYKSDETSFHNASRTRYPSFFVTLDVMHFVSKKNTEAYQLIQMTLQAYLKGLLMGAYGMNADKRTAMGQALRLIGPLHLPEFRKKLIQSLHDL